MENQHFCKGCDCEIEVEGELFHSPYARTDFYGLFTGIYCDTCYETNYPYRKDACYDYMEAGEYMEADV